MPLSWLSIVDGVLGATDVVRWMRGRSSGEGDSPRASTRLEARLAGVVVSALKEAFARDHQRVEFERQRLEEERERADRLLRLEWLRQAGEREIGRLRLLAGVSAATWLVFKACSWVVDRPAVVSVVVAGSSAKAAGTARKESASPTSSPRVSNELRMQCPPCRLQERVAPWAGELTGGATPQRAAVT